MAHKRLLLVIPFCFLAIVSLACSVWPGGASANSLQATANAALTQAAAAAATAGAQANSLGATAAAASTNTLATANAAGAGQPTASATAASTAANASSGPQDVPLIDPHTVVSATDVELIYNTSADIPTVVKFYQDQMPKLGWAAQGSPYVSASVAKLGFTKTGKSMVVAISIDPNTKQTVVDALIE